MKYLSFICFLVAVFWASWAFAHGNPLVTGIIPRECVEGICTDVCSLAHTGQHILNLLIALAVPISVAVIMYNAFRMIVSAGSPEMFSQGKKGITLAITGLLVVFGAWILINSLFVAFARQTVFPWPWHQINCR